MLLPGIILVSAVLWLGDGERRQIREARRIWEDGRPPSYEMTFIIRCFCAVGTPGGTAVTVVGDDPPADLPASASQITVDGLYGLLLESWLQRSVDEFYFEFNPVMGFPEYISIDLDQDTADDEFTFFMVGFGALAS
jgi:hypothetical protein